MPVLPDVGSRMIESGPSSPRALEVLDEVLRDAVLDRPGGVQHLQLREDADVRVRAHPRDLDERRVPDRLEDVAVAAAVRDHRLVRVGVRVPGSCGCSCSLRGAARGRPSVSRRPSPAGAGPRRPPRPACRALEVADVLAVDVDVDEPVELAVVGQQLAAQRRVPLDERVDDRPDRAAVELQRLGAADVRPQHGRDEDRAHARASGETVPAAPVMVIANGTSSPTPSDGERLAGLARGDGLVRADRAFRVAAELQLGELGLEGIEQQQPAGERVADPEQDLERLVRLEQAEDARHDAEHAGHGAAGRELGRRRRRVEAAVARALERDEGRELALEAEDRGVDRPGSRPRPPRR